MDLNIVPEETSKQDIIVQRKRGPFFLYILVFVILLAELIIELSFKFPAILAILLSLFLFLLMLKMYMGPIVTQHLRRNDPALVINNLGIQINQLPWEPSAVFLSWEEIKTIYSYKYFGMKLLCIIPKIARHDLSQFGTWKVFFKSVRLRTGAPLNLPADFMNQSIDQILQEMQADYIYYIAKNNVELKI